MPKNAVREVKAVLTAPLHLPDRQWPNPKSPRLAVVRSTCATATRPYRPDGPGPQAAPIRGIRGHGLQGDRVGSRVPAGPTSTFLCAN